MTSRFSRRLRSAVAVVAIAAQATAIAPPAAAFCGFYVAQADAKLFNKASKVVLAWDDGKTAVTMGALMKAIPRNSPWSFPRRPSSSASRSASSR
jgi:hypothetical protein